jgi:hypothetical protein
MFLWIARLLLFRRFGGLRGVFLLGLLNFVRRRLGRRTPPPGVYEPALPSRSNGSSEADGLYQPSQGSSQTVQRRPR